MWILENLSAFPYILVPLMFFRANNNKFKTIQLFKVRFIALLVVSFQKNLEHCSDFKTNRRHKTALLNISQSLNPKKLFQAFGNRWIKLHSLHSLNGFMPVYQQCLFVKKTSAAKFIQSYLQKENLRVLAGSFSIVCTVSRFAWVVECFALCGWEQLGRAVRVTSFASSACLWRDANAVILQWQTMSQLGPAWERAFTRSRKH